jgi:hypothetical protein
MSSFVNNLYFGLIAVLLMGCTPPEEAADSGDSKVSQSPSTDDGDGLDIDPNAQAGSDYRGDLSNYNVVVTAGSLAIEVGQMNLQEKLGLLTGAESYDGIGTNYSEVVVEGLKIKLTAVSFGSGVFGTSSMSEVSVFDWAKAPKELEIRDGFEGVIEESAAVPAGSYDWLKVGWLKAYELKGYAYFDRDNNGTADYTMYTSATEVKLVASMLDMSTVTDYAYFKYSGFDSNGPNDSNGTITIPTEPLAVKDESKLYVNLKIDSYRAVKAWDGRLRNANGAVDWAANPPTVGQNWDPNVAPAMGFPFNSAMVGETSAQNRYFTIGTPAFAMTFVPMFVTASEEPRTIVAETYLMSWSGDYTPYNTSAFIVLIDSDASAVGVPFIGQVNGGDAIEHLHVGPTARHFTVNNDGSFNFYTGTATGGTKPEWNDGGFYYNRDIAKASHRVLNFPRLAVGVESTALVGNAARCHDEYNYCVPDSGDVKSADNGATKVVHVKRVR